MKLCQVQSNSSGGCSSVSFSTYNISFSHQCPPAWREITEPVRTCGRTNETVRSSLHSNSLGGCSSVSFSTYNISFSHICGRIKGYQLGSPDAFQGFSFDTSLRIEDPYVDGVVITRGTEKEHVWTFAASLSESADSPNDDSGNAVCPCTSNQSSQSIPSFVGQDYFCETGITGAYSNGVFYSDGDPLWDGEDCGSGSTCCELNGPPYFCKSLIEPTTDNIEVRICADQSLSNEGAPIELIEMFVQ